MHDWLQEWKSESWMGELFIWQREGSIGLLSKIITTVIVPKVSKVPNMFQLIHFIISTL